jgi:hypothetical protein
MSMTSSHYHQLQGFFSNLISESPCIENGWSLQSVFFIVNCQCQNTGKDQTVY